MNEGNGEIRVRYRASPSVTLFFHLLTRHSMPLPVSKPSLYSLLCLSGFVCCPALWLSILSCSVSEVWFAWLVHEEKLRHLGYLTRRGHGALVKLLTVCAFSADCRQVWFIHWVAPKAQSHVCVAPVLGEPL